MNRCILKLITTTILSTIMIVGVAEASTLPSGTFKRLSGNDRIETAIAISKEKNQTGGTVIITNAYNFTNALAGSALCYQENKATMLLTDPSTLDSRIITELNVRKPTKIIILGNNSSVSAEIENQLNNNYGHVKRISGKDNYSTAVAIGQEIVNKSHTDTAFIANGENYADALVASTFAATKGYPIVFTNANTLNANTQEALSNWGIKKIVLLGGTGAISSNVEKQLSNNGLLITRLGGENRYETAKLILDKYYDTSYSGLTICYGEDFPDALAGVSLAAEKNAPIMLYSNATDDSMMSYIKAIYDRGYVIGGLGVLPEIQMSNLQKGTTIIPTYNTWSDLNINTHYR